VSFWSQSGLRIAAVLKIPRVGILVSLYRIRRIRIGSVNAVLTSCMIYVLRFHVAQQDNIKIQM
jgi:hypothetical protein